jgi:hypothetical protein
LEAEGPAGAGGCGQGDRVSDAALIRLLQLLCQKLGAVDARVEIGGRAPMGDELVWTELSGGRRVVLTFDAPLEDAAAKRRRLDAMLGSFAGIAQGQGEGGTEAETVSARVALDDALVRLGTRVGATQAVVIDVGSPVLWGSSHDEPAVEVEPRGVRRRAQLFEQAEEVGIDLAALLARGPVDGPERAEWPRTEAVAGLGAELGRLYSRYAALDVATWRRFVLTTRAVAAARRHVPRAATTAGPVRATMQGVGFGYFVRAFAGIYLLVLVFDAPFSELRAQRSVGQALPRIERLVLRLPPVDPRPSAKVVRIKA